MESSNPKFINHSSGSNTPDSSLDKNESQQPVVLLKDRLVENESKIGKNRLLVGCEYCSIFFLLVLCTLMIACAILLVHYMPYEPIFWIYIFCMLFYWIFVIVLLVLNVKIKKQEKKYPLKNLLYRPSFWILISTIICSFGTMLYLLKFVVPDAYESTYQMKLRHVSGVTSTTAKFFIRDYDIGTLNQTVGIEYRVNGTNSNFQFSAERIFLPSSRDFTGFVQITDLDPGTVYEWKFEGDSFSNVFKTNPTQNASSQFSFYFGSCFLNNFPNFQQAPGFGYVADLKPDLFFFIGDFIYSDIPFFRGDDVSYYYTLYRNSMKNRPLQKLFQTTPNYHMWDDHELRNDYPNVRPSNIIRGQGSYENAISKGWKNYIGEGNPSSNPKSPTHHYFDLDYGDSSFALIDTRTFRVSNALPDNENKTMLGVEQKLWLKNWLMAKNETAKFKFILSPIAFTEDFPSTIDAWGNYLTERDEILEFIRENHIEGVLLLTGDSHFAYAAEINGAPGGKKGGFLEFSASPISAFDHSLGGLEDLWGSSDLFKPLEERKDNILFSTVGQKVATSLLGLIRVDTTLPIPQVTAEIYDRNVMVFNYTMTVTQMRPWEAIF